MATDIWSREKRSQVMALIPNKSTKPELALRGRLSSLGFKSRGNVKELPGRPDLVFPASRLVVFVHGCFWHGCPEHYSAPKHRAAFWRAKLLANQKRDRLALKRLKARGWKSVVVWEHEIDRDVGRCARLIASRLKKERADRTRGRFPRGGPSAAATRSRSERRKVRTPRGKRDRQGRIASGRLPDPSGPAGRRGG
jgi:DNA mismatch endonuclease, patch repair protein